MQKQSFEKRTKREEGSRLLRAALSMAGLFNFAAARWEFEPANNPFARL